MRWLFGVVVVLAIILIAIEYGRNIGRRQAIRQYHESTNYENMEDLRAADAIWFPTREDRWYRTRTRIFRLQDGGVDDYNARRIAEDTAAIAATIGRRNDDFLVMGELEDATRLIRDTGIFLGGLDAILQEAQGQTIKSAGETFADIQRVAETKADAVDVYVDTKQTHTNDPQNSHDTQVNVDLRNTLDKIWVPALDTRQALAELREYIDTTNEDKREAAVRTFDRMSNDQLVWTFKKKECDILAQVWNRSFHPDNAAARENIQDMIVGMLADASTGEFGTVCVNGRTSRVISALATLDFDPEVGSIMTRDAYRNQILQETKQLFDDHLQKFEDSEDADHRAVAKYYNDVNAPEPPADAESLFKRELIAAIDRNLARYSDRFSASEMGRITADCHAVV